MACVWKWAYYAPNTYKQLKLRELKPEDNTLPAGYDRDAALTLLGVLFKPAARGGLFSPVEFLSRVLGPMLVLRFLVLPAPLLLLPNGASFYQRALTRLAIADVVSNLHAFLTIVTNHAGDDLYRFSTTCSPGSGDFMLRQVISSANYRTGGDLNDFMHGWLNYQAEHHVWPSLSMLSYQKAQPELEAICLKHGVPYVQESVFRRLKRTLDVMVGKTSMRNFPELA
jgi:fatty acid desaturase